MADCNEVPLGSRLVVLLKGAMQPIKKIELFQMLGVDQMDKAKQNEFKNQVSSVLDTAVNLGFVQTINGYYMPITHASDIADVLGLNTTSYITNSASSFSGISTDTSECNLTNMEMGTRLIFCLNSFNEPVRKADLLSMMGVENADESKANDLKNEIDTVLDEAVNLGFIQACNGHYMPVTHCTDVAELLDMDDSEYINASTPSMVSIISDGSSYIITDNALMDGGTSKLEITDNSGGSISSDNADSQI